MKKTRFGSIPHGKQDGEFFTEKAALEIVNKLNEYIWKGAPKGMAKAWYGNYAKGFLAGAKSELARCKKMVGDLSEFV